jgi:dihydroorotase
MTKFMALGLSTSEVLSRVTIAPARAIGLAGRGVGTLKPGVEGDVVVLRIEEDESALTDAFGGSITGDRSVKPVLTIQRGRIVFDDGSLPRVSADRVSTVPSLAGSSPLSTV